MTTTTTFITTPTNVVAEKNFNFNFQEMLSAAVGSRFALPALMRAAVRDPDIESKTHGKKLQRFVNDLAVPTVEKGSVIVKVKAAATNPHEYKMGTNWMLKGHPLGFDVAGVVVAVHKDDEHNDQGFQVGDEVFGNTKGSMAEYASCDLHKITKKPKFLSWEEAAAVPLAYCTVYQAILDHYAGFSNGLDAGPGLKGARVLVLGASGGSGTGALQIIKAMGAKDIVAVSSGRNSAMVKKLGATEVVDYTKDNFWEKYPADVPGKGFDFVLDCVSGSDTGSKNAAGEKEYVDYKENCISVLDKKKNPNAKVVALNGDYGTWTSAMFTPNSWLTGKDHSMVLLDIGRYRSNLDDISMLFNKNYQNGTHVPLPVHGGKGLPFTEEGVDEAYEITMGRRAQGKVVVRVDPNDKTEL